MQLRVYCSSALIIVFILISIQGSIAGGLQSNKAAGSSASRRISFSEAQKLLLDENEGNMSHQPNRFSRTKLGDGSVLELYYPLKTATRSGRNRAIAVSGYGIIYESEAAYKDATRPRHMLEDLIPDGQELIDNIPSLIVKLETRLRLGRGKLDYSRSSLKRIDSYIYSYQRSRTTAQTDPRLFQELTAYYGEMLRKSLNGRWRIHREKVGGSHVQSEPNISYIADGKEHELKPWSSVIVALYDEDNRGKGLMKVFDDDITTTR